MIDTRKIAENYVGQNYGPNASTTNGEVGLVEAGAVAALENVQRRINAMPSGDFWEWFDDTLAALKEASRECSVDDRNHGRDRP